MLVHDKQEQSSTKIQPSTRCQRIHRRLDLLYVCFLLSLGGNGTPKRNGACYVRQLKIINTLLRDN